MLKEPENMTAVEINVTAEELLDKSTVKEIKIEREMLKNLRLTK